jgi:membrane protein DedA with SNARE-associated domain
LEYIQIFVDKFLAIAGEPHLGLFLLVWFSAINPLAFPEEAFTLVGGACIAKGILHPFWAGLAIIGGIIATNDSQYWLGRGCLKLFSGTRLGKRFINSRKFLRARESMAQRGIWAIVLCRFFFGTRAPTYIATGFLRYRFFKFMAVDSTVVCLHGIPLMIVGYIFSDQIESIIDFIAKHSLWSLIVLVIILVGFFGINYLKNRRDAVRSADYKS